ncbi:hypothetical protein ACP4OV_031186 [Aristida adscensionis]
MACHVGLAGAAAHAPRLAVFAAASSSAAGGPVRRIRRRAPPGQEGSAPPAAPAPPSVAEVRRAIGADDDEASSPAASREARNSAFMDLIANTPIGQPESEAERRIREVAEWVVETTEERAFVGQKSFLVLCMMTFPVWFFLLFIALGVIELPFDIPDLDNLIIRRPPRWALNNFCQDGPICRVYILQLDSIWEGQKVAASCVPLLHLFLS